MLVLSRNVGGKLMIGDDIEVMVLNVSGNQVRLGVVAPKHVAVDREEIRQRKNIGLPPPDRSAALEPQRQGPEVIRKTLRIGQFGRK